MKVSLDLGDRELDALADRLLPRLVDRLPARAEHDVNRLLAAGEVAKLGGWPNRKAFEQALYRARQRGELHDLERAAVHVDGVRRFPLHAVNAWIAGQR